MKRTGRVVRAAAFGSLGCAFIGDVLSAATASWWIFAGCVVASLLAAQVVGQVIAYDAEDRAAGS